MKQRRNWQQPLAVLILLTAFFVLLFYGDNKYENPPPYGKSGRIVLSQHHLEKRNPVFLIDGWLLTDERVTDKPVYIGEFSNLQRGDQWVSPHGKARYELTLCYDGEPMLTEVDFPRLSYRYTISLDGMELAQGAGNGRITFLLTAGDHVLTVETTSALGYYSGMYFPPALGTSETLRQITNIQSFSYALALLVPLALASFTLFLWRTGGGLNHWFGLLCCFYALYMFRYFVFLFSLPMAEYWFWVQSLALYGLCFCVVRLTALASNDISSQTWRRFRTVLLVLPAMLLMLCLLIPVLPWAVFVHGRLTDLYYVFTFFCAAFYFVRGTKEQDWKSRYTLAGCLIFGAGLMVNLLFSNLFEPIRFFWQFEWCGLLLVLLFGAMMISRSRRLLRENDELTTHLEDLVEKRTEEVTRLLNERKAFFSDMAHDLKAPVFATQSFIEAIRRSGVGVDAELKGYLDQAEAKQWEMARRLEGLSAINTLDKIEGEWGRISLRELLSEIHAAYYGEAQVQAVHFVAEPPEEEMFLMAQPEKLDILFENLIYNALKATPQEGTITVSAWPEGDKICMAVADTGCGIPKEEQALIFRRFYVGKNSHGTGTGLGLYIVQSIVTEFGGTIRVCSEVGKGTRFVMEFPKA